MEEQEVVMEVRYERVPLKGFEEDYARYVERKAQVEEEVREEYEKVLNERTAKLDQLIGLTSELIEVVEEPIEDNPESIVE